MSVMTMNGDPCVFTHGHNKEHTTTPLVKFGTAMDDCVSPKKEQNEDANDKLEEDYKACTSNKGLEGLLVQKIEGVNYLKFSLADDLIPLHNLMRQVTIRSDDVITVGFPRSGNHWTFEVVAMILRQKTEFHKDHFYSRLLECLGVGIAAHLEKISSPRNLTSHFRLHSIPTQAIQKQIKLIYVLRNPKDALASLYKFCTTLAHDASRFTGSWDDFFNLQMQSEFPYGSWFDHVLATEAFRKNYPECPVFILVYEKMKENPSEQIKALCSFLEKPDVIADDIASTTKFENMKAVLGKSKMAVQASKHFKNGPDDILRKGIIGDWKNWFTVAQSEAFNKLFEEKMAGSELGDLVREYIQ